MPYPDVDPYETGDLTTPDGATLHWEESGNPNGAPAIYLHGGPGGSLGTGRYRRFFDPSRYRLVGLDQRGSGRSRPRVGDEPHVLDSITTPRLVADLELLRTARGVDRWTAVGGVSWGSTLALAYALEHRARVGALALMAVTTTGRDEVDWITEGVGRVFPAEWDAFERASGRRPGERVVEAYARLLRSPDPAVRAAAAQAWDRWEGVHVSLDHPDERFAGHVAPPERERFAAVVTHVWANDAFLPGDRAVLTRVAELADLPATLVHGRRDISSPVITAWRLHQRWPASRLVVVEDEGHGGPRSVEALTDALDQLVRS